MSRKHFGLFYRASAFVSDTTNVHQQQGYNPGFQQPAQSGYTPGQHHPGVQSGVFGGPARLQALKNILNQTIQENKLQSFYPPNSPALDILVNKAAQQLPALAQRWRIPMEIANDLVKLGLYDVVLFIGTRSSLEFSTANKLR
jgi:hypothetical protein